MEIGVDSIILLVSFICFVLAALGVAARVNLVAIGLALWVLVALLTSTGTLT